KAVNEMKTRVIDTLQGFANTNIPEKYVVIRNLISQETGLSYNFIQEKSAKIFNNLLHNYAAFDILTIDKFTHRVIRSFATDVGLPPDFELTLDMDQLLQLAVERIIEKTGTQPEITSV
ncbi:UvrD-helicase domain-containing protein, partial [Arthrospira platensis SPKY1]|nr:UvrD-helicase domain-containing protein [Arthrospira platensis SPKY1]